MKKAWIWLVAVLVISPALAQVYKWKDTEGNIHYGDVPQSIDTENGKSNIQLNSVNPPVSMIAGGASTKRHILNTNSNLPTATSRSAENKSPEPSFTVYGNGVGGNADVGVGNSSTPEKAKIQERIKAEAAVRQARYDQMREEAKNKVLPWQLIGAGLVNQNELQSPQGTPENLNPEQIPIANKNDTDWPSHNASPQPISNCDSGGCWDTDGNRYNGDPAGITLFGSSGACQKIGDMMHCP